MFVSTFSFLFLCTFCFGVDSRAVDTRVKHTSNVARYKDIIIFPEDNPMGTNVKEFEYEYDDLGNRFGIRVGKCPLGFVRKGSRCKPA